jgi:hypothetical protein
MAGILMSCILRNTAITGVRALSSARRCLAVIDPSPPDMLVAAPLSRMLRKEKEPGVAARLRR